MTRKQLQVAVGLELSTDFEYGKESSLDSNFCIVEAAANGGAV